jgi:hypothetical protein
MGEKYAKENKFKWFTSPSYEALVSLSNKVPARKSIVLGRLLVDKEELEDEERKKRLEENEEEINQKAECYHIPVGRQITKQHQEVVEVVIKALLGDVELLSRLQDLPYLKAEFSFDKNSFNKNSQSQFIAEGINREDLESKLVQLRTEIEREE